VALLHILVERAGALVSKDALIEAAWPGLAIDESNLTGQIAALRRALGMEPGGDKWIETLLRRGYRFVGPAIAKQQSDGVPEFPLVKTADKARNNQPVQLTSFIGRAAVLGEIKGLRASNRLVTLAGVGGSGKTRLAIKIGTEVLERFADDVWLVEFAALSDLAFGPHGAMSALSISEQRGRPLTEILLDYMRPTETLAQHRENRLVADGFEWTMERTLRHTCPSQASKGGSNDPQYSPVDRRRVVGMLHSLGLRLRHTSSCDRS
jgi:Transcriptional regulatory protein, C terminal